MGACSIICSIFKRRDRRLRHTVRPQQALSTDQTDMVVNDIFRELAEKLMACSSSVVNSNFDSIRVPGIRLESYLFRLACQRSPHTFVIAFIYVCRANIIVTDLCVHRLFLACFVLADKYQNDDHLFSSEMASLGGVSVADLHHLERLVAHLLEWKLWVSVEEFEAAWTTLHGDVIKKCRKRRKTIQKW